MNKVIPFFLTVALIVSCQFLSEAQSFYSVRRERSLIFSAGLGNASYFGELKNSGELFDAKPSINVGLQYYFTSRISMRGELNFFTLKGDDAKADDGARIERNLSFTSANVELNATGMISLFPLGHRFYQRPKINPYGFIGVGLMFMNPKAEYDGKKYALQPLETEGVHYSLFQPVIPYGLGVKIKAGPFFNVAVESGWRLTFTDYIDDVSTVYADQSTWTDPIRKALADRRQEGNPALDPAKPGSIRGNSDANDQYFMLSVKIEYYLSNNFFGKKNRKLYNVRRKAYYR